MPGPGQYIGVTDAASVDLEEDHLISRLKKGLLYPSFGTKETRALQLINEEETGSIPGPGKYELQPFNVDDLMRYCDDKILVKEILANL